MTANQAQYCPAGSALLFVLRGEKNRFKPRRRLEGENLLRNGSVEDHRLNPVDHPPSSQGMYERCFPREPESFDGFKARKNEPDVLMGEHHLRGPESVPVKFDDSSLLAFGSVKTDSIGFIGVGAMFRAEHRVGSHQILKEARIQVAGKHFGKPRCGERPGVELSFGERKQAENLSIHKEMEHRLPPWVGHLDLHFEGRGNPRGKNGGFEILAAPPFYLQVTGRKNTSNLPALVQHVGRESGHSSRIKRPFQQTPLNPGAPCNKETDQGNQAGQGSPRESFPRG